MVSGCEKDRHDSKASPEGSKVKVAEEDSRVPAGDSRKSPEDSKVSPEGSKVAVKDPKVFPKAKGALTGEELLTIVHYPGYPVPNDHTRPAAIVVVQADGKIVRRSSNSAYVKGKYVEGKLSNEQINELKNKIRKELEHAEQPLMTLDFSSKTIKSRIADDYFIYSESNPLKEDSPITRIEQWVFQVELSNTKPTTAPSVPNGFMH